MSSSVPNQTKLSVLTYVSSNNSAHRSSPSVNAQPDKDASNEPLFAGMNFRVSELTGAVLHAQLAKLDPLLRRLQARRAVMAKAFGGFARCRVSPHNDPDNAAAYRANAEAGKHRLALRLQRADLQGVGEVRTFLVAVLFAGATSA